MRGILLAGGSGSRLHPTTKTISKQLLPVYDKPAIYYPLSTLMFAGIREIMIISTPRDLPLIENLLGDGAELGLQLRYRVQETPQGIAHAFLVAGDFLRGHASCLILGDNLFYGPIAPNLERSRDLKKGAAVFGYRVQDPERFGVVEVDNRGRALSLEEKPAKPKSNWAVTGLYFYDDTVVERTKTLKPSARGELEITDLNKTYLADGQLAVEFLGRGVAWLDIGTHDSLLSSSVFVQTIEQRQGLKIACLEEIAYYKGFIDGRQFSDLATALPASSYGQYVKNLAANPQLVRKQV